MENTQFDPKTTKLSTERKMELLQIGIFSDEIVAFTATGASGQDGGPFNIALRSVFSPFIRVNPETFVDA